ncbi:hypothetical protein [Pseudomonas sp. DC3000-4b1]
MSHAQIIGRPEFDTGLSFAESHTSHFALETHASEIIPVIQAFLAKHL